MDSDLQTEIDRGAIVALTNRVTAIEEQVSMLRDLVRQIIISVEEIASVKQR